MDRESSGEAEHLRTYYAGLQTSELQALQARGGLTEVAVPILADELAARVGEGPVQQAQSVAPATASAARKWEKRFAYVFAIVIVPIASFVSLVAYGFVSALLMLGSSPGVHEQHLAKASNYVVAFDAAFMAVSVVLTSLNRPAVGIAWSLVAGVLVVFVMLLKAS